MMKYAVIADLIIAASPDANFVGIEPTRGSCLREADYQRINCDISRVEATNCNREGMKLYGEFHVESLNASLVALCYDNEAHLYLEVFRGNTFYGKRFVSSKIDTIESIIDLIGNALAVLVESNIRLRFDDIQKQCA